LYTNQYNFANRNIIWDIENPVYRFVTAKNQHNGSVGFFTTDDIDVEITRLWRASVDNLVYSQYVDLVQGRTVIRRTSVNRIVGSGNRI
jgi:hypothetical protein